MLKFINLIFQILYIQFHYFVLVFIVNLILYIYNCLRLILVNFWLYFVLSLLLPTNINKNKNKRVVLISRMRFLFGYFSISLECYSCILDFKLMSVFPLLYLFSFFIKLTHIYSLCFNGRTMHFFGYMEERGMCALKYSFCYILQVIIKLWTINELIFSLSLDPNLNFELCRLDNVDVIDQTNVVCINHWRIKECYSLYHSFQKK